MKVYVLTSSRDLDASGMQVLPQYNDFEITDSIYSDKDEAESMKKMFNKANDKPQVHWFVKELDLIETKPDSNQKIKEIKHFINEYKEVKRTATNITLKHFADKQIIKLNKEILYWEMKNATD